MSSILIVMCVLIGLPSLRAKSAPVNAMVNMEKSKVNLKLLNKTMHFVNEIKNNLRRNNEDYDADKSPEVKLNNARRRLNNTGVNISFARPAADLPQNFSDTETTLFRSFPLEQIASINQGLHRLVGRSGNEKRINRPEKPVTTHSTATINDEERISRLENWKRLVERSNRLRTGTDKIEPTISVFVRTSPSAGRLQSHTPRSPTPRPPVRSRPPIVRNTQVARARPLHAGLQLRTVAAGRAPPNADQLDMAPARGAYIHDLRVKNLFCHRNVLWPEGPKYDSHGNTIMPAFDPKLYGKAGKSFIETTTALFILPRCCNCCKKSVLGCQ